MKGIWEPWSDVLNGVYGYWASRKLNVLEPIHGGNTERHGEFTLDRESVVRLCEILNAAGQEHKGEAA
jgi:hypothetical protein